MTLVSKIITSLLCLCSTFQIQMYWEDGYTWQERDYEFTKFCWTRNYMGLKSWGICYYGRRIGLCWPDAVYIAKCGLEDTRQMWTFKELRGGEFQIKAPTQPMCLERINSNDVRMRICDSSNESQRFSGNSGSRKFSISQGGRCLGQKHHPKNGEVGFCSWTNVSLNEQFVNVSTISYLFGVSTFQVIEMESCNTLKQDQTLYWEKMWG